MDQNLNLNIGREIEGGDILLNILLAIDKTMAYTDKSIDVDISFTEKSISIRTNVRLPFNVIG